MQEAVLREFPTSNHREATAGSHPRIYLLLHHRLNKLYLHYLEASDPHLGSLRLQSYHPFLPYRRLPKMEGLIPEILAIIAEFADIQSIYNLMLTCKVRAPFAPCHL